MAASSSIATQMLHWRTQSPTGIAIIRNEPEGATQTFLQGTPVVLSSGNVIAATAPTTTPAGNVCGISTVPGANLTTAGVAKTLNLPQTPPNQPSAVITPLGSPPNDGTSQFLLATGLNTFVGTLGDSSNNALAVLAQSQVGSTFGIFKDPGNNYWYIDHNVTAVSSGACVIVENLIDPVGTLNGRVEFRFTAGVQQL